MTIAFASSCAAPVDMMPHIALDVSIGMRARAYVWTVSDTEHVCAGSPATFDAGGSARLLLQS